MIKDKKWFPVVYMFAVTFFFSSIVIGLTQLTADRVEANQELAFERAVVNVLPGLHDESKQVSRMQLHSVFVEEVLPPSDDSAGAYMLEKSGIAEAYALPFSGQGFWAEIRGVLGISDDMKTVTAVAFYQQNETPGLGAEIAKPEFTDQFKGKVFADRGKPLTVKRPSSELDKSSVHAVTGATQTSVRLEKMINDAVSQWRKDMSEGSN